MKKLLLLVCTAMFVACPGFAKKKKVVPPKPAPKREVRKPATKGLFNVQRHKEDWYLQVPDSLLGRPFLANTRFVSTPVEAGLYGGELANSQVLYWELHGKQLLLRSMIYEVEVGADQSIAQAVRASNEDPIVASIRLDSVESRRDTTHADKPMMYSVKVNDLFKVLNEESYLGWLMNISQDDLLDVTGEVMNIWSAGAKTHSKPKN